MLGKISLRKRGQKQPRLYLYSSSDILIAVGIAVLAYRAVFGNWPELEDISDEVVRLALVTRSSR